MTREPADVLAEDPHAQLERSLIDEFLRRHGHTAATLHDLPPEDASALMKEATLYASARLTEVESRAHYIGDIHRGGPNAT